MNWTDIFKKNFSISLKAKVTLAITSLVSISIIIATYISLYRSAKIFRQELKQQSEILLNTLEISTADSLNLGNIELIKSIINQISMQEILITARAYQQDGRVIADSNIKEQDKLGLEIDPLGTKILQNKTTFFDWQTDRLIAGKILMTNNEILGAISIEVSNASLKQKLALERNQSLMLALITASITSLVAFIFSRSITEPLKQMITATQYIAAGDLNYEMVVSTNDELAILARTFNFMTTKLKTMVDNLELRAEALHQSETLASEKALQLEIALKELQKAKLAAESANKAKSVFLSNMSHELRTPLNGILGYAQILQRDLRNQALCAPQSGSLRDRNISPQQSHGLKIIYESGNHLLTLINDILDLSKIEASKLELYPSEVHCQSFFNGITNIIRMQALEKDILFECLLSPSLPIGIQADEKRLRQVLLNLLGNAVKFTDQGKVTLKVSTIKSKIYSNIAKETLRFEVIDTGVGISAEQLEQIFKPFLQVGNIKRREAGTGLGLAISTELVTLMGSKIRVKSKLDKGSTFWFDAIFPVINNASFQHKLEEHQIIGYKGRRRKILVVDDKQQNRLLVVNMLKPLGFELTLAEDGQQEIDLARQIKPDCILTDLVMPVKNGFEAVKEIRKIPSIKDVIIIAISASVLDSDQKKSRIVGCEAFLPKPIEEKQLFSLLQEYLELEWIYETIKIPQVNPQQKTDSILTQTLIAPPIEEIEILYELAMLGSMKKIRERADYLEQLDDKYLPFARKLKNLARGFQEKAIVNLVEKYL